MTAAVDEYDVLAAAFKDYAYSVSHDLSAPVRAMVEFSKLLSQEHGDVLSGEAQEYLSLIVSNGQKMQSMMDGLLAYSRLNTQAKPLARIDCNRILDQCREVLQGKIRETGAIFEITHLPTVRADADQAFQLFVALLDNALKFQPRGNQPKITVSAEPRGAFWQFSVVDNGIGIKPQFHEKIFKLFQRLHAEEEYPGVGIGLTLVERIIQRHGGKIWCEVGPGGGTAFCFTFLNEKSC